MLKIILRNPSGQGVIQRFVGQLYFLIIDLGEPGGALIVLLLIFAAMRKYYRVKGNRVFSVLVSIYSKNHSNLPRNN